MVNECDRAQLCQWPVDIVVFYEMYLRNARYIETDETFIRDCERAANEVWYELGLYEKYGHDYFDRTYHSVSVNEECELYDLRDMIRDDEARERMWQ